MSILDPKIFTTYGALDSDAMADGRASDAHVLRTLAMSANRLATRGQPLAQIIFNAADETVVSGANGWHKGWAVPFWMQITPTIRIVKKPSVRRAKLFWQIGASSDGSNPIGVQIATEAAPFDPTARVYLAPNVFGFVGSTSPPYGLVANKFTGIPLREGPTERVTFYLRGTFGDEGDEGTHGEPSSGDGDPYAITSVTGNRDTVEVDGASWNDDGWSSSGHAIMFRPGPGGTPTEPRWINAVYRDKLLRIFPPLEDDQIVEGVRGGGFTIYKIPAFRIYSLSLYADEE